MAAYSNSLKALSSKPMENVRTGSGEVRAMDATTELESIPPLKNAPNGTSAIIRMRTDSSNLSRNCPHTSASDRKSTRLNSSHLGISCRLLLGSEEHTSELQSLRHLVCRLLLVKKKHTSELQALMHIVCWHLRDSHRIEAS